MSVVGESIGLEVEETFTVVVASLVVVGRSEETLSIVVPGERFLQDEALLLSIVTLYC